jgi:hypothetical protein
LLPAPSKRILPKAREAIYSLSPVGFVGREEGRVRALVGGAQLRGPRLGKKEERTMKRGMVAVLLLVLLTSLAWGTDWYRYQGTLSRNWRAITGETSRYSWEAYVLLSDTTPQSISFETLDGEEFFSGEFDQEGTKLQFRASSLGGNFTLVGRGSFNARETTLNLQSWAFWRAPGARSLFGQYRFRGEFVDIISR